MTNRFFNALFLLITTVFFAQENNNSLLWKVEGNGLTKPSYVYGTVHIMCKDYFRFSETLQNTIKSSDVIAMEANINDMKGMMEMQQLMTKIEKPLTEFMNDDEEKLVDEYLQKKLKVSLLMFNQMKPAGLLMTLSMTDFPCEITNAKSYEKDIFALAKKENKELFYFETLKEQWTFLDALPDEEEVRKLVEMVKENKDNTALYKKMLILYQEQKLEELYSISTKEMGNEEAERLLYQRNEKWIPKIEKTAQHKSMFIAVGAAHLSGERGVLNLLKQKGYKVTPVVQ